MNLLGAKLYDPAVAVSKSTASLLAMTAFDTTNLRVAVTVPAHGMLYVRVMGGSVTGATTVPTILLGVMNGATVLARITPQDFPGTMNAATQSCPLYAEFVITGLTPGAMNLDLAYGVEVVVAATAIKYGGPNDTTTNNAWGGISFQVWDPQPLTTTGQLAVDANGRVDVSKVAGTTQTARDLGAQLDAAVSTRLASAGYTAPDNTRPANFTALSIDASGRVDVGKVAGTAQTARDLGAQLDATVSSRSTFAGGAVASVTGAVGSVGAGGITSSSFGAGAMDAAALATDAGQEIADRIIARNVAGGSDGGRTIKMALARLVNRVKIALGVLTVYDTDDSTALLTQNVTTTAGNPVSEVDTV